MKKVYKRVEGREDRSGPQALPRGGACVSCRRRKMKCDGKRPICSQCDRSGRDEDCEYTTSQEKSTAQILEDNISLLEARIQELQANPAPSTVGLHRPYGSGSNHLQVAPATHSRPTVQDPPRHIAEALITNFLQHASQVGFFLNVPRFYASMLANHPCGHPARPAPALIFSAYLWAVRLSNDPTVKSHEEAFLTRATQDAATALSSNHPERIMHFIQAEILLANYFFAGGRFFEGKYHVTAAVSTSFSGNLHKIRSSGLHPPSLATPPVCPLHTPRDVIEEGERIIAVWNALNLDKCWSVALEHSPNFEYSTHPLATSVDTPWPLEMEEFEQGRLPRHARTANTVQNFLNGIATPDLGLSTRSIEAKAAVLLEQVAIFVRKCDDIAPGQHTISPFINEFTALNNLIEGAVALLPSPDPHFLAHIQSHEKSRRLALAYSMLCAAVVRLYGPYAAQGGHNESSRRKRVTMARRILEIVLAIRSQGGGYLNPIIGTFWIEAAQVLFDEIILIRALRASGSLLSGTADDMTIMSLVQQSTAAMIDFSINIPLTSFQVGRIQETYATL